MGILLALLFKLANLLTYISSLLAGLGTN